MWLQSANYLTSNLPVVGHLLRVLRITKGLTNCLGGPAFPSLPFLCRAANEEEGRGHRHFLGLQGIRKTVLAPDMQEVNTGEVG